MDLRLRGRKVLVTGASRGIGEAVARAFAAEGCDLYISARSSDLLDRIGEKLRADYGVRVVWVAADLALRAGVEELVRECADADIVVNNAGAIPGGRLSNIGADAWRQAWDLKVYGYIDLCRSFYDLMSSRGSGVLVNIIGASGNRPKSNYICGATANAALMAFTQALGGDSLEQGVRVVGINPGPIETERLIGLMKTSAKDRLGDETRWRELTRTLPGGRAGTVEEVAAATIFAASDLSSYTSGTIVTVDGGYSNRGSLM